MKRKDIHKRDEEYDPLRGSAVAYIEFLVGQRAKLTGEEELIEVTFYMSAGESKVRILARPTIVMFDGTFEAARVWLKEEIQELLEK